MNYNADEIRVGEYARTTDGIIGKVGNISKIERFEKVYYTGSIFGFFRNEIKKHSKNIIDVIEVGDLVKVKDNFDEDVLHMIDEEFITSLKEDIKDESVEIKSILTHEQYDNNCYIVKK